MRGNHKRRVTVLLLIASCVAARIVHAKPDIEIPTNVREYDIGGVHVISRPSGPANHVIVAKIYIRGGITALPNGVSPGVEDLALEVPTLSGPQGSDRAAFQRELQRMVTTISPASGRDFSTFTLRCVDETFDRSWTMFSDVIMRPSIDPVELRNAKDRSVTQIRNRYSVPEAYATYLADSTFFYGHPYGRFAREADFAKIDSSVLMTHFRKLFVKSRLLLVVVGNVDSAELQSKVMSTLAKLPQGSYTDPVVPVPPNARHTTLVVHAPYGGGRAVTNYIVARYLAPNRKDSLYYPMLRLISFVSGSLFREVRIQRNLSYAPDADVEFANCSYGDITISTTLPDSAWRVARGEVIDFFRDYVIGDQYVKGGLNSWITSNYMREQTNESQANELGKAAIYTGSWQNAFTTVNGIANITPEQMNEAAQRYLKNFTVVIVGNPAEITPGVYTAQSKKAKPEETSTGGDSVR